MERFATKVNDFYLLNTFIKVLHVRFFLGGILGISLSVVNTDRCLTLFRLREGKNVSTTSFSPVTFLKVGFSPQNLLNFCFNSVAALL